MPVPARVVLDTNVWLDWLVFDDPVAAPLRAAQAAGAIAIFIDAPCTEELRRVLAYSFRNSVLPAQEQAAALEACLRIAATAAATTEPAQGTVAPLPLCRDPDDQKFLELARASRSDILLTKDRALLELVRRKYAYIGFRILTPQAYVATLTPSTLLPA
jgi:putative PIN family toxin of toxin-antitoxin system